MHSLFPVSPSRRMWQTFRSTAQPTTIRLHPTPFWVYQNLFFPIMQCNNYYGPKYFTPLNLHQSLPPSLTLTPCTSILPSNAGVQFNHWVFVSTVATKEDKTCIQIFVRIGTVCASASVFLLQSRRYGRELLAHSLTHHAATTALVRSSPQRNANDSKNSP